MAEKVTGFFKKVSGFLSSPFKDGSSLSNLYTKIEVSVMNLYQKRFGKHIIVSFGILVVLFISFLIYMAVYYSEVKSTPEDEHTSVVSAIFEKGGFVSLSDETLSTVHNASKSRHSGTRIMSYMILADYYKNSKKSDEVNYKKYMDLISSEFEGHGKKGRIFSDLFKAIKGYGDVSKFDKSSGLYFMAKLRNAMDFMKEKNYIEAKSILKSIIQDKEASSSYSALGITSDKIESGELMSVARILQSYVNAKLEESAN